MSSLLRVALVPAAVLGSLLLLASAGAGTEPRPHPGGLVEVVVTLPQPPLAEAIRRDRELARAATVQRRLNVRAPASVAYLRALASAQRSLQARIQTVIPDATVRWRYGVVVNGMAVVVPRSQLAALSKIRGATVWPSVTYHALSARAPQVINAPSVWGPTLATSGSGMKIGIIDDGLDQTHAFFDPTGFSYPLGFPKGNTAFTTAKVIVAKAFPPPTTKWKYANTPFDPDESEHATHVAGSAAGDYDTLATLGTKHFKASGVAPNAYIGNYKVLTVPTEGFGLDGNSPEIAKGIEEAVKDGMDVINLSLGEPEIEPSRDIVVAAIDHAADAGVVPVVAAGNDFAEGGRGTIGSPGTAPKAITVAAATLGDTGPPDTIAGFSSSGPTPISLQFKPDVTAPGVDILSSIPHNQWDEWQGTSMATPQVSGAAAILKERHPGWTTAQIKSALVSTGAPVRTIASPVEVPVLREGGGRIDLARADNPLVFTDPTSISFGLVRRGTTTARQIALSDAGGGPAAWSATIAPQATPDGVGLSLSAPVGIAGGSVLSLTATTTANATEGDAMGFVQLTRGTDVRRVPYWLHVEAPQLGNEPHATLSGSGLYGGNTAGRKSLVSSYRYPEGGLACNCKTGVPTDLTGPEQVFRLTVKGKVANFGAVVLSQANGVRVSPRLVRAGDENRLVGYTALPVNVNPYQLFGKVQPVVGAVLPAAGAYDFVFDTPAGANPGKFTFRVWINDTTPPSVRLLPAARGAIRLAVTDAGSGVDFSGLLPRVDGRIRDFKHQGGVVTIGGLSRGKHRLVLVVSDYQEAKNMENTGPILPNTRTFTATVRVP